MLISLLQVDLHYNGFCNSVLWQLFHYVPLNMDSKLSETRTLQFQWAAHQEANRRFAQVTLSANHSTASSYNGFVFSMVQPSVCSFMCLFGLCVLQHVSPEHGAGVVRLRCVFKTHHIS